MSSLPRLHPDIVAFLDIGLSIHLGACASDGQPQLTRGLAVRTLADGAVEVLVPSLSSAALRAAGAAAGPGVWFQAPDGSNTMPWKLSSGASNQADVYASPKP